MRHFKEITQLCACQSAVGLYVLLCHGNCITAVHIGAAQGCWANTANTR